MEVLPLKDERNPYRPRFDKPVPLQCNQKVNQTTSKKLQVMKLRNIFLILAAITLGFASCSSESDILNEIDTPAIDIEDNTTMVSINIASAPQTKGTYTDYDPSVPTENPQGKEPAMYNCMIAIFDASNNLLLAKREITANGEHKCTFNGIETKAILSKVLVVANYENNLFDNCTQLEQFHKEVKGIDAEDANFKLVKFAEELINFKDDTKPIIMVKQLCARIDLDLSFKNNSGTELFHVKSVEMDKRNIKTRLFKSEDNLKEIVSQTLSKEYDLTSKSKTAATFYSYPIQGEQATLTITGTIGGTTKTFHVKVAGSDNHGKLESGCLYKITGTIVYENKELSVTLGYEVADWNPVTVDIPAFK